MTENQNMDISTLYNIYLSHPVIVTDSRTITQGCLFFALKGERFNGNLYAQDALEKGAAYAIIDEKKYKTNDKSILVDDVLATLQALATYHRQQLGIPIVAITGSNGKTTTKELMNVVLATAYQTSFTAGNFNNHIGVPLTLLRIPKNTEIAIVEMGANHQREIAFLCEMALPDLGVINNIGKAHLEGFGGIEGVKKGKAEMYDYLSKNNKKAFVNIDLPFLKQLAEKRDVNIIPYVDSVTESYSTRLSSIEPFVELELITNNVTTTITSHLIGQYNYYNILTAIAIGKHFNVTDEQIKTAIESYIPDNNRSQILQMKTNTYILDAYNANPTSTQHAMEHFAKMKVPNKIAILGDMLELGEESEAEHLHIALLAQNLFFEKLILVGREFAKIASSISCKHFDDVDTLKSWITWQKFENSHFLLKGSRGMKLEKLIDS